MKKRLLITSCILLASFSSFSAGIPVTDIPRVILEFIVEKVLMQNDQKVQIAKLQELLSVLQKAKEIRARHTEILGIDEDFEKELRLIREVEHLKLQDILPIAEKVLVVSHQLYAQDVPYLEEYALLKGMLPGLESSNRMFDYLHGGTTLYAALRGESPAHYGENIQLLQQQAIKQYGLEVDAAQRALHTALSYQQLSKALYAQAADLQEQVGKEGRWELRGIGDIFANLLDGLEGEAAGVDLSGLGDLVNGWAADIRKRVFGEALADFVGNQDNDRADKVERLASEWVGGFDFEAILGLVTGGLEGLFPVPAYAATVEKEGMGMTTGERIEAQAAAVDNLEKSLALQLEADQLMLEATQKSVLQQKVDATYQHALLRSSMRQVQLY